MRTKRRLKVVLTSTVALILAMSMWLPSIAGRTAQAAESSVQEDTTQTVEKALTTAVELRGEANVEGGTNFKNAGWAGMKLTVGDKDIVVTEVGRYCTPRSNATHNLMILNADYSVLRAGMTITRQEEGEGFVYAKLEGEQRVTLQKNSTYYVVADFYGDRDMFYDASIQTTTGDATIDGIVNLEYRSDIDNWVWCDYAAGNISWGPMDIKYEVEETIEKPVDPEDPDKPVNPDPEDPDKPDDPDKPVNPDKPEQEEVSFTTNITIAEEANVPGASVIHPMGFAGMRITVGSKDLKVTSIGRWYTQGSGLTHNYMIHDTEGNVILDYGKAVSNAAEGQADGFVYGSIEGGVTLKANTTYYLVSDYWGENDKFYASSVTEHTDIATLDGIAILNVETNAYEFYSTDRIGWGPMDFKYIAGETGENPGKSDDPAKPDKETQEKKYEVAFTTDITIVEEGNVPGAKVTFPMGFAGMRITVGSKDIVLSSIGRWYTKGSALTHNYMIHDTNGNVILDYGKAVSTATEGQKDGFVYGKINGGVTLKANTTYYLVSDYWGENDKFYTASVSKHTKAATLDGIAILNPATEEYEFYPAEDIGWGPMDFKYLSDSPKTGDTMGQQVPLCICGILVSICVLAIAYYKKRQHI